MRTMWKFYSGLGSLLRQSLTGEALKVHLQYVQKPSIVGVRWTTLDVSSDSTLQIKRCSSQTQQNDMTAIASDLCTWPMRKPE